MYDYEIWMCYEDVDWFGNRTLTKRELAYTAKSLAQVGRLVGLSAGQVSYAMQHQGEVGWTRGASGTLFRVIRKYRTT